MVFVASVRGSLEATVRQIASVYLPIYRMCFFVVHNGCLFVLVQLIAFHTLVPQIMSLRVSSDFRFCVVSTFAYVAHVCVILIMAECQMPVQVNGVVVRDYTFLTFVRLLRVSRVADGPLPLSP